MNSLLHNCFHFFKHNRLQSPAKWKDRLWVPDRSDWDYNAEWADVRVAQQQRLCLFSGESVTDPPAVNSRATAKAKTKNFIVPFRCCSLWEIRHRFWQYSIVQCFQPFRFPCMSAIKTRGVQKWFEINSLYDKTAKRKEEKEKSTVIHEEVDIQHQVNVDFTFSLSTFYWELKSKYTNYEKPCCLHTSVMCQSASASANVWDKLIDISSFYTFSCHGNVPLSGVSLLSLYT